MKSLDDLQKRLIKSLENESKLRLPDPPWNPLLFEEVMWIVEAYISDPKSEAKNSEQLSELVDRYKFHRTRSPSPEGQER